MAKLRRPSPAAWAVNQLARRHRADLEDLLRLGEALRATQDRTLGGADAGELRQAARARRDALARLTESAMSLLEVRGAGAAAHQGEVAATLEAASVDPEAAAEVSGGRLTTSLEPPAGFGGLGDVGTPESAPDPAPSMAPREDPEPAEATSSEAGEVLAEAQRAAADTSRLAAELSAEARRLVALAAERHREVDESEAEAIRVLRVLDEARLRADDADHGADEALRAAAHADTTAVAAADRLREAERDVSGPESG